MRLLLTLLHQIALGVAVILCIGAWMSPAPGDRPPIGLRVGAPLVAAALAWPLLRARMKRRREQQQAPLADLLKEECGHYFVCRGFCFAFVPDAADGISRISIFFQNCHANPCTARVVLQSRRQFLSLRRLPFPGIDLNIDCGGGAYGCYTMEWPIPAALQGRTYKCEVASTATFRDGPGPLLRPHAGTHVLTPDPKSAIGRLFAGLMFNFVGGVSLSHATLKLRLPDGVAGDPVDDTLPQIEILWEPAPSAH